VPNSIYITGDTHRDIDIKKISKKILPEQKTMDKTDYLIICGDFGGIWNGINKDGIDKDRYFKQIYEAKNFTTLFIDGNHDNHNILDSLEVSEWHGGKVHIINQSLIHLMRGQVYEIYDKLFFTMGGGNSCDKKCRSENISWWSQEMPNLKQYEEGIVNLQKHNNKVNYIVTHTTTTKLGENMSLKDMLDEKELGEYIQTIENNVGFEHAYFGHFHVDKDVDDKHTALYQKVLKII